MPVVADKRDIVAVVNQCIEDMEKHAGFGYTWLEDCIKDGLSDHVRKPANQKLFTQEELQPYFEESVEWIGADMGLYGRFSTPHQAEEAISKHIWHRVGINIPPEAVEKISKNIERRIRENLEETKSGIRLYRHDIKEIAEEMAERVSYWTDPRLGYDVEPHKIHGMVAHEIKEGKADRFS